MQRRELDSEAIKALEQVLGYLNFSTGAADSKCHAALNAVFASILDQELGANESAWQACGGALSVRLTELEGSNSAFQDCQQARQVLTHVFDQVIPSYLDFHRNLLFHQDQNELVNAFFVGRTCEIVLRLQHSEVPEDKWDQDAVRQLNDFVGYRPIPTLESHKHEPYAHEFVRPVPLFVRDAGVAAGRYQDVVAMALEILEETDEELLRAACFAPECLDELAFDPRAYDCEHPVNKRPNYHFGMWDPHLIDNRGFYRRFIVQQVTLNALMRRFENRQDIDYDERLFEAGAVLAGTILMAAGISGGGPDTHSSDVTLTSLLPHIARYRDKFYEQLIHRAQGEHHKRLSEEAKQLRQPFGGARQDLNAELARRRAAQLEHVHLARLYARMGFSAAAAEQAEVVPTASARMMCQIDCLLTEGELALEAGDLERATPIPQRIWNLMQEAIQCGAMIDPWNILGFDAQFSLFPGLESSVHDHRADELVAITEQLFALNSRIWSEAAARDRDDLCASVDTQFEGLSKWWRQFAAHEVTAVESLDGREAYVAAKHVAQSLQLWHRGGASSGDVKFWAPHADLFDSPKAYSLVIEALLERKDFVASQALLIHWLSQVEQIGLEKGDSSFHELAELWMVKLWHQVTTDEVPPEQAWDGVIRFFDFLEANAEDYWRVPDFQLNSGSAPSPPVPDEDVESFPSFDDFDGGDEDEEAALYGAAYEEVVYRDSTDDGIEGNIVDDQFQDHDELQTETDRLESHLAFIATLSRLWRVTALFPHQGNVPDDRRDRLEHWIAQASANQDHLQELLRNIHMYRIVAPGADQQSMVEYDRKQVIRQSLVERIIVNCVENANAMRLLQTTLCINSECDAETVEQLALGDDHAELDGQLMSAVLARDCDKVRALWPNYLDSLYKRPLLYVPVSRDGDPERIVEARVTQHLIYDLLRWLPRLGLLVESFQLIEAAREMERDNPVGPGAVTEFDELFRIGYKSLVEALVDSSDHWTDVELQPQDDDDSNYTILVELLEKLTESLLIIWLAHSRTLRLSVMERANEESFWNQIIKFIKTYGDEIFTQHFLNVGNVRAILHQGVDAWLEMLEEDREYETNFRLIEDLDDKITRRDAVSILNLILEAVFENYSEYRDYNSTTTQSDRGDMLYTLLDFLRLRCRYDRICWNLKPVIQAHETLVRKNKQESANLWRQALQEKITEEADSFLDQLAELQESYAMKMPTIADRLNERFVRPIAIDRICSLVAPAVARARQDNDLSVFDQLAEEIAELTEEPSGVGLDVPTWLIALEEEVERVRSPEYAWHVDEEYPAVESTPLSFSDASDQITKVANNDRALKDDRETD